MRRIIPIVLLTVITISATDFMQFMKLPALASHYLEHKADSLHLSFVDFLMMHYASHDHNDQDQDRDMQLPFKNVQQSVHTIYSWSLQHRINQFALIIHSQRTTFVMFDEDTEYSHFSSSIWQPPKPEHV